MYDGRFNTDLVNDTNAVVRMICLIIASPLPGERYHRALESTL